MRQRWPIGNETGEVSPRPDLAAVPTNTAPMCASPVNLRCTLGGLLLLRQGNLLRGLGRWHGSHLEDARQDEQGQQCPDPEQDIDLMWGVRPGGSPGEEKAWCNRLETPGLSTRIPCWKDSYQEG